MMRSRFRFLIAGILGGGCPAAGALQAFARDYPTRPIRLVVPSAAGGPTDLLGRTVAQKLGEICRVQRNST